MSCQELKTKEGFFNTQADFSDKNLLELIDDCEFSLKNQKFTQKLYQISNQIRGNSSICSGLSYLRKLQEFQYLLLQIPLNPTSYQKKLKNSETLEQKYNILKAYFRYWAYQSIGNFRLYREFWQEYNKALKPLEEYFQNNFDFDKGSNIYYTSNALNEFLNWAVGETKIQKDLPPLSKFVANKNNDEVRLGQYILANQPSSSELTLALRAALLNQRDVKILKTLLKFGAKIDEGYESAIFYALENETNTAFLIDEGADVNHNNAFGKTPLFYAIEFNNKNIIRLLIERGANIHQKYINNNEKLALSANIGSDTPYFITLCALEHTSKNIFMHAASYSDVEILKFLVAKGVDIFALDDLGFNALDFALMAHKKENAAYLQSLGLKANENLFYGDKAE